MNKSLNYSVLLQEQAEHIELREVLNAYWYLIGFSECLSDFEPRPVRKGVLMDYRYLRDGENWFAFIVNRKSLLFYFRSPSTRSGRWPKDELAKQFNEVLEPRSGEVTVRISSTNEARRLMALIFLLSPA
jgi:hypothetical protein